MEGLQESPADAEHLTPLHAAYKAFFLAESSEKIRRVLRGQTRGTCDMYPTGQEPSYKRKDQPRWRETGEVIGQVVQLSSFDIEVSMSTHHIPVPPVGVIKGSLFHSQHQLKSASMHPLPIPSATCMRHSVLVYFLKNSLSLVDKTIFR